MNIRDKVSITIALVGFSTVCVAMPVSVRDQGLGDILFPAGGALMVLSVLVGIWWPARQPKDGQ